MYEPEEPLTQEQFLLRFKRVFGREMTPEEKRKFFLLPEAALETDKDKRLK
jgi:hypothetical protein